MIFRAKMNCSAQYQVQFAKQRAKSKNGFTLLEIVFVLGMIAVLVTWITLTVSTVETETRLREAAGDIGVLAKRARNIAVRQQRPYALTIAQNGISIAPQYTSLEDEEIQEEEEGEKRFEDITATEKLDSEVKYEIRRWRSDEWLPIEGKKKVVIVIEPEGLVEPISIRCSFGKSWLMQELHPLTANVRDEEMSVEKE